MADSAKYRHALPQRSGALFLTDGGIETTLIFQDGLDLPYFAAFHLLRDARGREALVRYYERYIAIAKADGMGFILESPTWRASADWGAKLGYSADDIVAANRDVSSAHARPARPPRDSRVADGGERLRRPARRRLRSRPGHDRAGAPRPITRLQIAAFADAGADMVSAITMTNANEAIGIARAAAKAGMPVAISFTVETDGRLPTGPEPGRRDLRGRRRDRARRPPTT